jgi:hypothetical protein
MDSISGKLLEALATDKNAHIIRKGIDPVGEE